MSASPPAVIPSPPAPMVPVPPARPGAPALTRRSSGLGLPPGVGAAPARVLFVNDTARNGGPGRSLQALLRWLEPEKVHRTVLLPRPGEIADLLRGTGVAEEIAYEPCWVENIVEPWQRPIVRADFDAPRPLRLLRAFGNAARMGRAFARLRSRVARGRFDLIYCNGTIANFMGAALGLATGRPVLWHVRYTSLPGALQGLHRRLSGSRTVRRIVCVSRPAAALFGAAPDKVVVVHNGVDTEVYDPAVVPAGTLRRELGLAPETVIFGAHGRILRKKGFVELLLATKLATVLLRREERARLRLVVVGDTPQDFQPDHLQECRQLAATLGIDKQVTFTGFRADVRACLADFDVAVVPSIYPDPLPRAVIESLAMGRPVIAFAVGGVAEMLSAEEGVLVRGEPPDVQRLADAMVRLFRDPAARGRLGAAARARAVRDFDARVHAARVQAEILGVLAPAGGLGSSSGTLTPLNVL